MTALMPGLYTGEKPSDNVAKGPFPSRPRSHKVPKKLHLAAKPFAVLYKFGKYFKRTHKLISFGQDFGLKYQSKLHHILFRGPSSAQMSSLLPTNSAKGSFTTCSSQRWPL
ncbi:hypothetical protein CBL_08286 [Carabus blaptoides fortunei]